ncbi:MAG: hypothetical protein IKH56_05305 [Oscillospiraceae bacterium]|nr:hypothetical protein [Oscillospiraceae bacterium]
MAIGDYQWLSFKNKRTRERDAKEYEEWAFPYGQRQRDRITELLAQLFPKEEPSMALVCHLTAKELVSRYHDIIDLPEHHDFAMKNMAKDFKKYRRMFHKSETRFVYAALGMADLDITEDLNYPTLEELRAKGAELEILFDRALND